MQSNLRPTPPLPCASPFNAVGVLSPAVYDALVPPTWACAEVFPQARSVVVVGHGGPAFVEGFLKTSSTGVDPLDRYTALRVHDIRDAWIDAGHPSVSVFYWEQRAGQYADFRHIASAAGLGAPSKLGLLLHPRYGPWISIRALVFTAKPLPPTEVPTFDPCTGCHAPCEAACPGKAVGLPFDTAACSEMRQQPRCRSRCDARHACIIGRDYAYGEAVETFHANATLQHPDGP